MPTGPATRAHDDPAQIGGETMSAMRPGHLPIEIRETHSGIVVLVGDRAYKAKKPVRLGFLDFTHRSARDAACRREVELNRRLAPDAYLGIGRFMAPDAGDASSDEAEPVIVMRRMPDEQRLSTLVSRGDDVEDSLRALGRLMARFHAAADRGPAIDHEGGPARLWHRWSANLRESEVFCPRILDPAVHAEIKRLALRYVDGRRELLSARARGGLTVDGHGDLIAEDIFCLPAGPAVLDCLEFDDRLRYVDVLDDVCFLAMDLDRLGRADLATRFLAWYAEFSGYPVVPSLQHHYVAYRAFVRTKVACIRAEQGDAGSLADVDICSRLTLDRLQTAEVRLVVVGGTPGTGKTTVAAELACELGYVLLRSDAVRQEVSIGGKDRYSPTARAAVYAELLTRAARALRHGESVVIDATWATGEWRRSASRTAEETVSRLVSIECVAPVPLAAARAEQRLTHGHDLSDAGAAVALGLARTYEPWPEAIPVDTSGSIAQTMRAVRAVIAVDAAPAA